jgi:peptidoglycan/xylan/chitin deacetylase (PgdA/CDA1 family)
LLAGEAVASPYPAAAAAAAVVELHDRLASSTVTSDATPGRATGPTTEHTADRTSDRTVDRTVALTLDACGGGFDAALIDTLVERRIPATLFVTKKWIDRNPVGVARLLAHPELFELEDHGTAHLPAVLGTQRRVYGLAGVADVDRLRTEVAGAAETIAALTGRAPRYYRGATAMYDPPSLAVIRGMGYQVAGFSLNADAGATLSQAAIVARLRAVQPGDVIIAHMNKPAGATAEAMAVVLPELQARGWRFVTLSQSRLEPQR